MNILTKFDALGSALAELSFRKVSLEMERSDGSSIIGYIVWLHHDNECSFGEGKLPNEALENALRRYDQKQTGVAL